MKRELLYFEEHYLAEDAKWLIFIHGAGGGIATWNYQKEAFKPYFNLLLLDLRDHGQSKGMEPTFKEYNFDIVTRDILDVLDAKSIEQAYFISLSMGSILLQKLENARPGLVERMVTAGGIFKPDIKIHLFAHSGKFLSNVLTYKQIYTIFSWIVMPKKNHELSRRVYRIQSQKLTPEEYMKWMGLYKEFFKVLRQLFRRELMIPCLVVMGKEDHMFLDAAKKFVERQPQAIIKIIEQCGHIVTIDKPEVFNREAMRFLMG